MGRTQWNPANAEAWAAFVRERMEELGMNIRELAEASGFSAAAVSLWLAGERRPSPTSCMALGNALFVDGNTLIELAGVRRITLHSLRHTCATLLLEQGVHPRVVSEILGHASIEITMDIYSHVDTRMQQKAAELLALSLADDV